MKKKQYLVFVIIIIITLIGSAVVFANSDATGNKNVKINKSSSNKKIQISLLSSWGDTDTKAQLLAQVIQKFEKENPNVEIINNSISGDRFLMKLKTDFAQGNAPDVFGLWPGSDLSMLINAGMVADLTQVFGDDTKWYNSISSKAWDYDRVNGRIYGIPFEDVFEGLYINKDIFNKYNLKVPSTFDELLECVRVLRKHDIIPIAYNSTAEGTYIYQNIVMKLAGKTEIEENTSPGNMGKYYIDGMNYMKQLYKEGAFPQNYTNIDDRERDLLFLEKNAAMIVQGSWFIGEGSVSSNDPTVSIVPFPSFKEGKSKEGSVIYGIGNGNFHISSNCYKNDKKRELCIKFLREITYGEYTSKFENKAGFIENNKDYEDENKKSLMYQGRNMILNSKELVKPPDSYVDRSLWEEVLVKNFPLMFTGEIAPSDILKEINEKYNERVHYAPTN